MEQKKPGRTESSKCTETGIQEIGLHEVQNVFDTKLSIRSLCCAFSLNKSKKFIWVVNSVKLGFEMSLWRMEFVWGERCIARNCLEWELPDDDWCSSVYLPQRFLTFSV